MKYYMPKDFSVKEIKRSMRAIKSRHQSKRKKNENSIQVASELKKCFRVIPFELIPGQDN